MMAKKSDRQSSKHTAGRLVVLRTSVGEIATIARAKEATLIKLAKRWMYILRNRSRWTNDEDAVAAVEAQAAKDLGELGITALRGSSHIEVEVVDERESGDQSTDAEHAAAVFPW